MVFTSIDPRIFLLDHVEQSSMFVIAYFTHSAVCVCEVGTLHAVVPIHTLTLAVWYLAPSRIDLTHDLTPPGRRAG